MQIAREQSIATEHSVGIMPFSHRWSLQPITRSIALLLCGTWLLASCAASLPVYETPARPVSGVTTATPVEGPPLPPPEPPVDRDLEYLADIRSSAMLDRGVCEVPIAQPDGPRHPNEPPVFQELQQLLQRTNRIYHFGGRHSELCHVDCGNGRWLCGAEALEAVRAQWRSAPGEMVISRFTGRTMVGVFENYWHVRADGTAVHYYHGRTDFAPDRCTRCGWNREVIAGFMRADGTPRLRAEGTSGN